MIAAADRDALRAVLGADAVREHEPVALDGAKLGCTVEPADAAGAGAALRVLGERGLAAVVRGGGTKLAIGNLLRRADAFLGTARMSGVAELDADDGVVRVRAGTPIATLRAAARAAGWDVALEGCAAGATVGGVLASAETGPRVLRYGRPRDVVLGLEVALATGEVARCGGRVVKNVTGYDLAKLYVGSLGTLCVIDSAWLRLRPAPAASLVLAGAAPDAAAAVAAARSASDLASVRIAALVDASLLGAAGASLGGRDGLALVVEHAGAAELVEAESRRAAGAAGLARADAALVDALTAFHAALPPGALRVRVGFRPSRAAAVIEALRSAGGAVLAHVASGHLLARFDLAGADEVALDALLRAVRASEDAGGGHAVLEAAPAWVKQGRDVFGGSAAAALHRAVKQRFDPHGALAPGRFLGGI